MRDPKLAWYLAGWWRGAAAVSCGLLAQWLLHVASPRYPFVAYAIGDRLIRETPGAAATAAIDELGHLARPVLAWGVVAAIVLAGVALRRTRPVAVGAVVMGASGVLLGLAPMRPGVAEALAASGVAGLGAALLAGVTRERERAGGGSARGRRLVLAGALAGGLAVLSGGAAFGRSQRGGPGDLISAGTPFEGSADPVFAEIAGISPLITEPDDHYVVDINLSRPYLDRDSWRLRVDGDVERPRKLTFERLLDLETVEIPVHLHCISNILAGDLMGNATWVCARLGDVIGMARPRDGWETAVVYGADGYTGTLTREEAEGAYVALGMGGRELPPEHGYPARLLFPGHYGMRGVKWVTRVELVRGEVTSYWAERGWDAVAPLRPGSRIEAPRGGTEFAGRGLVAGTAWGPDGVDMVEVSADGGATWEAAELEAAAGADAWRRWSYEGALPAGTYEFLVRATSGGVVQDGESRPPHPSGASGYHRRTFRFL